MPHPLRLEFPGAVYHIYSRGNERKDIFRSSQDYELFLNILAEAALTFDGLVHAYCLLPNHFHLLLETKDSNLSQVMKRLLGLYTVRFNKKHQRSGHLFQGRYKALIVDKDAYFLQLSRYIHLNPVKAKLAKVPEAYRWSSMRHYLKEKSPQFLFRDFTLGSFNSSEAYRQFVMEGLSQALDPFKDAMAGALLGTEDFLEKLKARITKKANQFHGKEALFRKPLPDILKRCDDYPRNLRIYLLSKYARATQKQIGERFDISNTAVSQSVKRLEARFVKDKKLKQTVEEFQRIMSNVNN
ncbi:MAG: transposase [Candidatus Omnitrophica bacterium]|nr:transposase [Candidatus Omnitrophota bacterium]